MKETLREKIERLRMDTVNQIEQLYNYIEQCKAANDFENAMKSDIKRQQLIVTLGRLDEALR